MQDDLCERVAELIATENVIGWFQGRMEFGPRALGSRSIIGDARSPKMQSVMNLKIKFRESFHSRRCVFRERAHELFDIRSDQDSPYMLVIHYGAREAPQAGRARQVRYRQTQSASFRHPGDNPRRLLGTTPDRR